MKLTASFQPQKVDVKVNTNDMGITMGTPVARDYVERDPYTGDYSITPSAEEQILATRNLRMTDNITVKFVDAAEYEGLEECSLGDYVNIYYVALGIVSENVEIVSLTYNVLTDSVTEMELGQIKTTFAAVLEKTLDGGLKA